MSYVHVQTEEISFSNIFRAYLYILFVFSVSYVFTLALNGIYNNKKTRKVVCCCVRYITMDRELSNNYSQANKTLFNQWLVNKF